MEEASDHSGSFEACYHGDGASLDPLADPLVEVDGDPLVEGDGEGLWFEDGSGRIYQWFRKVNCVW